MYPMQSWKPIYESVSGLNDFDPKVREFRRYFLNGAMQIELDSAGRMLLPKSLIEHGGLDKDIILVSAMNKMEIWDKNKYQQFFETFSPESFSSLAAEVMAKKDQQ
jgi:MraZ protein